MHHRLLIVSVRFEDLPESEVLLPRTLDRIEHLQRPPRQVNGVVQILQGEQDPGQVQEHVRIVWGYGQRSSEAFDRFFRVTFYAPELTDLVVQLHRLWFLE